MGSAKDEWSGERMSCAISAGCHVPGREVGTANYVKGREREGGGVRRGVDEAGTTRVHSFLLTSGVWLTWHATMVKPPGDRLDNIV